MEKREWIRIEVAIHRPMREVWDKWTGAKHIVKWNFATDKWHCPQAQSDFRPGGRFLYRMEAKDGLMGFDFSGQFDEIKEHQHIRFHLDDDRSVKVTFLDQGHSTVVIEEFEAESDSPVELQQMGWQAILENFKAYVESDEEH